MLIRGVLALLVALLLAAGPCRADITSNLVGYWALNDGTGTTAADASGNGTTLTLVNTPTWVAPGKIGAAAVAFASASSQKLSAAITSGSVLWPGTGNWTAAAWVKLASTGIEHGILGTHTNGDQHWWFLRVNTNGTLLWSHRDGTTTVQPASSGTITDTTTWHHVAASVARTGNVTWYIDGSAAGTGSVSAAQASVVGTSSMTIGATGESGIQYANATIDEARVYSRALSSGDITELVAFTGSVLKRRPLWLGWLPLGASRLSCLIPAPWRTILWRG